MVKVTVIKVYQPNIFLGTDQSLFDKIANACNQLKSSDSLLTPCNDVAPQMVLLYDYNNQLMRLRVLSAINPNTFRCLLIDHGRIEEVKKHRMYIIPMNQLKIDPAVKLYKITGLVPAGLNLSNEGCKIKATLSQSKEWIRASYKFVCQIFHENPRVYVSYVKECSKDKALVDVFVIQNGQRENLKELLIRENFAFAMQDDVNIDLHPDLSNLSLEGMEDKLDDDCSDSIAGESISKILEDFKEDESDSISINSKMSDVSDMLTATVQMDDNDSLSTNRSTFGTLDEISSQVLNNKVKSWLVSKTIEINNNDESVVKYEYKTPVRAILSYQKDQMIAAFLKDTMVYHKTKSLLLIQALMIPSILRGINLVAIAPSKKGKSMGMVMPILQKIATKPVSRTRSFNPLAIILCTSWIKVKELTESAKSFTGFINESNKIRKPRIVAAYAGQMEKKIMIPILEGCDILIITPKCLLRLLKTHEFFKLNELEILGLDDAEDLIAHHLDVLREIFIYKQSGSTDSGVEVHQIVTATNWTSGLQSFVQNEMGKMFLLTVNNPIEIAVFEQLKQKLIEYDKNTIDLYQKLLTYLEMTESTIKRTIIFASDDHQIRAIYKFLMQKVTFDLKLMVGSMTGSELKQMEREWNQYRGYVNMPVLLISDEALGRSDISIFNAHTILHADINPTMFGCRLNFLRDKFNELSFLCPVTGKSTISDLSSLYHSYVFVCASTLDLSQANFLYKFLGRCHSDRPMWLQEKAIDYVLNKEKSKLINEICPQIKVKGECQFPACTKRHIVLSDVDKPLLPNRGLIKFRLLHLVSPSNFFVRIMEHNMSNEEQSSGYKSQYTSLKMSIFKHFSDPKNIQGVNPKFIKPGFVAAIRFKDIFERVMVLKIRANRSTKIEVKLMDSGSTTLVDQSDLLTLPKDLMEVSGQAEEVFLTGIRPLDNDEYYNEESCKFTEEFLDGKDLYGVIMLWYNIVDYYQDFVERNPGHIQRLIRLCTGKIDIWHSGSQPQSRKAIPIMRKFTYTNEPLQFEVLTIQGADDDIRNDCTVLRVVSPNIIFLSNRDTRESIKQMQKEINSLIDSIETLPWKDVRPCSLVLFCLDSQWIRGYVMKIDDNSVLIFALDWGSVTTYTTSDYMLKKLPTEYQELPYHVIMSGLCYLSSNQSFSGDVNVVIENFVSNAGNKRILMYVTALEKEDIDYNELFDDGLAFDLDIYRSLKRYKVTIAKKMTRGDDEELFNVLVQKQCVTPAVSWIHIVLPESQTFISRLERSGSIPHLGQDVLSTRDDERRLKISMSIERIIVKNICFFENNDLVPNTVDAMLHTLIVLLHFVSEQSSFMCYYRAITQLLNLAYKSKLPLKSSEADEEFSISHISNLVYSYQSIVFHMLNHLHITIRNNQMNDAEIFLEMFKLLLVDSGFVNNFFEEESWVNVMAVCVGAMHSDERMYNALLDILVQLVMLSQNDSPHLAGILMQCCKALENSQSPSIWNASLALIGCLINSKVYYTLYRDLDFFTVLFDKTVNYFHEIHCWTEIHETSLDMLSSMWRNGSVDRCRVVRERVLSDIVRNVIKQVPGNENLARFLTDILMEESSIITVEHEGSGCNVGRAMPDMDAHEWMSMKDNALLKKHKKSYKKIYENKSDSSDEKESVASESGSSSDLEVTSFFNTHNPADEDNVLCYDRP